MLRSTPSLRLLPAFILLAGVALLPLAAADDYDQLKVGVLPDGRVVVPTNQILKPAGQQITFPGRPVDLAFADDGKTLVIKNMKDLVFLDVKEAKVVQTLPLSAAKEGTRGGFSVIGLLVDGKRVYASDAHMDVRVAERQDDGKYKWVERLELGKPKEGNAHPAGIARQDKEHLWVTGTRNNSVELMPLPSPQTPLPLGERGRGEGAEQVVPVGVAPYMVCSVRPDKVYVTNWGGDHPKDGDPKGISSGTPIKVDPRTTVANHGSVSVLRLEDKKWKQTKSITVGLHPSGLIASATRKFIYVANANSDTVSVIDVAKDEVIETIKCRPEARLPFGSGSNAVALSPDGGTLYVANGTNNCVAVVRLSAKVSEGDTKGRPEVSTLAGLIPTGWYPGAVLVSPEGKTLYVANVKGHGALSQPRAVEKGKNSHDHLGSVSIIPVPDEKQLAAYTKTVNENNRLAYSLAGLEKPRAEVKPLPVPQRHGEPSVFKHVLYVIKENRTYDQVLGDMKEGNGEPKLCIFGEEVTPNHHALARQFTLFDNFYCSGVLSADGHTWVNEAYVSDYLEKSFGTFTRSYPDDGSDHLAYVPTGFLWDNALLHKKTLRNFGEYVKNEFEPKTAKWADLYADYKNGTQKVKVKATANVKALEPLTHPSFPWFPLLMPDAYRAKLFIDDLKEWEKKGEMPNLVYLALPCNHTNGTKAGFPTPRAMVADNDLALGQIVEAVSHSKFWADTCIFVVEDDPQNGYDHVDGHRTVALVISPYTKRKHVDHTNYNQTGMVKTIELLLGLPPMNQLDLSATPMRNCFQSEPDQMPYKAVANKIPLDEMNKPVGQLKGEALKFAKISEMMNFDDGDAADEDLLNRILWHSVKGDGVPYPEEYIGKKDD
jgi:YVTN family beta-propeller protein